MLEEFLAVAWKGLLWALAGTILLIVGFKLEERELDQNGPRLVLYVVAKLLCWGLGGLCYLAGILMLRLLPFTQ